MEAAMLMRVGSLSSSTEIAGRSLASVHEIGVCLNRRCRSMRLSIDAKEKGNLQSPMRSPNPLRRVQSDTDLLQSEPFSSRWSTPVRFLEQEVDLVMSMAPAVVEEAEEVEYFGGGMGNGRKLVRGSGGEGDGEANYEEDRSIRNYYQDMLKADPGNPLLLRNYGRFLQEVEGDMVKAEEYYGRAILESPNDGELLKLYAQLVWESQRDCKRAEGYYERAVKASPGDCYVMGSYAHFLWDAEEEEGKEEGRVASSAPLVEAI